MPIPRDPTAPMVIVRRRQARGLMALAIAVLLFSILRTGFHASFTTGWWHLW